MPRGSGAAPANNAARKTTRPAGLAEEVYNRLLSDIMSLRLAPHARVSVDRLAREMAVSQTPIREALSMLETDGFVIKRQFAGYSTPPRMDRVQLDNLFELRLLVEPHAAARAARDISAGGGARLAEIIATAPESVETFARLDAELHALIAEEAGNRLIADSLNRLHIHVHIFRSCYRSEIAREAFDEHLKIGEAIVGGHAEAAERTMRDHIERSYSRLMIFIEAEGDA